MSDEHHEREHEAGREREEVCPEQEDVRREQEDVRREQEDVRREQEEVRREQEEVRREQDEVRREQEEVRREQEEEQTSDFQIQIDRVHYTVTEDDMTGGQLRNVPPTPIGSDRDLFEVVLGGPDRKISDAEIVEIRKGKRFFTAPTQINPGRAVTR